MKSIVINRMYAGSYLESNLGHEVINMFQADNGKHYLYLNPTGRLSDNAQKADSMLLVRYIGNKSVEILAMAKNLKLVPGADLPLTDSIYEYIPKIYNAQHQYITKQNITYGGVSILSIFQGSYQRNIFISYEVSDKDFFVPRNKKRIILRYKDASYTDDYMKAENTEVISLHGHNFNPHLQPQYIFPQKTGIGDSDSDILNRIINDGSLWQLSNEKVIIPIDADTPCCRPSLFDICGIQYNENCFSNALYHFMMKYRQLWREFFKHVLNVDLGPDFTASREVDTSIKGHLNSGGRIDLLLKGKDTLLIIENKIKSDINKVDEDVQLNQTQLDRYWIYGEYMVRIHGLKVQKAVLLVPDYNIPNIKNHNYTIIRYSQVCEFLKTRDEVFGDPDFHALYCAMLRHSHKYVSDMLYADMKCRFLRRIQSQLKQTNKY